jgi:crotonobetainyl-CoA:carnitine CoA-transferase CaiB-like acyl-CoA transferase
MDYNAGLFATFIALAEDRTETTCGSALIKHRNQRYASDGAEQFFTQAKSHRPRRGLRKMLPLHGVKIAEISHYMAGPAAGRDLYELGADVVKLEAPGGEHTRHAAPFTGKGISYYYATFNFGKKCVEADLRTGSGQEILRKLISWADIIVTNYSLGVPEKLGFGWEQVQALNPRTVLLQISGFGSWSKYRDAPAYDTTIQAMSGIIAMTAKPGQDPAPNTVAFGDLITSQQAVNAALAALFQRERTGKGCYVEVSMMRSLTRLLGAPIAMTAAGAPVSSGGQRFVHFPKTKDGFLVLLPIAPHQWKSLCNVLGRPDWAGPEATEGNPPRYVSDPELREEIQQGLSAWAEARTSKEAYRILLDAEVPCGPVLTIADLIEFGEEAGLELFDTVDLDGEASITVAKATPQWIDASEVSDRTVHPVGADTQAVLAEIDAMLMEARA